MTVVSQDIEKAAALLRNETQVAIPTETVYGLAGNIFSKKAIRGIFEMKQRPFFNPLIVHTHSLKSVSQFVTSIPPKATLLAHAFWPGPLTLVLPKNSNIPDSITAGKDTVAVRIPNHPLTLELLHTLDFPLAAPSANPFGSISPTRSEHVYNYFKGKLEMVLDGGPCTQGIESTIVGFDEDVPIVYRLGSIAIEDIEEIVGSVKIFNKKEHAPQAPGMLSRHYAPNTPTFLELDIPSFLVKYPNKKIGVLSYTQPHKAPNVSYSKILSPQGDIKEAMAQLYAAMHTMDHLDLDMIVAQRFPDTRLGKSINDRLQRATKGK